MEIYENSILSVKRNLNFVSCEKSVLSIPGILEQNWKPRVVTAIGKAWPKQQPNGRAYYKMQFDAFRTPAGKSLYAKAWSRKAEPRIFDVYADNGDLPVVSVYPMLKSNEVSAVI